MHWKSHRIREDTISTPDTPFYRASVGL